MNDGMDSPSGPKSLVERARAILLKPREEWPVIAGESASPSGLVTGYAVPLAAIGPVARFLHGQLFGWGWFGISWRPGLVASLSSLVVTYVLNLVAILVLALITDALAPKFGGTANRTAAFKLVIYGSTAAWLAGIFGLVPGLSILGLAGVYSFYLYYTGASPLMQVPQARAASFTVVAVLCAVALYIVIAAVTAPFMMLFSGGPPGMSGMMIG